MFNIIKNFTLKSVSWDDQGYVDEDGKFIIFRNVNGKTIPIHADSTDYAQWLEKNGIQIDTADQKTLEQIDQELEILAKAKEVGGPELQAKYENAFLKQLKEYQQVSGKYYKQALNLQAKDNNTNPDKLHAARKQVYEQNKSNLTSRKSLPDKGWDDYIHKFSESAVSKLGLNPGKDSAWYTIKAMDIVLHKAKELAQSGNLPKNTSLKDVLDLVKSDNVFLSKIIKEHILPRNKNVDDFKMIAYGYQGLNNLTAELKDSTDAGKYFDDQFTEIYNNMYNDFQNISKKTKTNQFGRLSSYKFNPSTPIPEDLPETFAQDEASSLFNVWQNYNGSRRGATHRVSLHTLSRLFDSVPDSNDRKIGVITQLSDNKTGLHARHKAGYRNFHARNTEFGIGNFDPESEIEEILRIAERSGKGTDTEKSNAMLKIAEKIGEIDAYHTLQNNPKMSMREFMSKWINSSLEAGRAKGDGPDLVRVLADTNLRKSSLYSNKTLKVLHNKLKESDLSLPIPEKPPTKEVLIPKGITQTKNSFVRTDGTIVTPTQTTEGISWSVSSKDGKNLGSFTTEKFPLNPNDRIDFLNNILITKTEEIIKPSLMEMSMSDEPVSLPNPFSFTTDVDKSQQSDIDYLVSQIPIKQLSIKTKIPGVSFEIKTSTDSFDIVQPPAGSGKLIILKSGKVEPFDRNNLNNLIETNKNN